MPCAIFNHLDKTQRERKGHIKEGAIGAVRFQIEREVRRKKSQKTTKESHYIGDGPDFQRSLFNLGGQSPLVLYYLQMHGISNTLSNTRAYRINHSEICKIPTPAFPTYLDVIKESQMFIHNLHDDFIDFEHRCGEELAQLEEDRRKMCKKYKRMMATITKKPTEARLKTEKFLNQVASAKPRQLKSTVLKPSGATM